MNAPCGTEAATELGSSRHLWVDAALVDALSPELRFRLHAPRVDGPESTQPSGHYMTILKEAWGYRAYCRRHLDSRPDALKEMDGNAGEYTACAESVDGLRWTEPDLDIVKFPKDPHIRNAVLYETGLSHNFCPFKDTRPDCPPEERYKALGGLYDATDGLFALTSPDGLRWRRKPGPPIFPKPERFAFDSQNVALYDPREGKYALYFRLWEAKNGEHVRSVARIRSSDFERWSEMELIGPNLPGEHLYAVAPTPYFRAPEYLFTLPTRFFPERGDSTDILFMSSRAGQPFERLFTEAIIRPGPRPEAWGNRANYMALGLFPAGNGQMRMYHSLNKMRYTWRVDGFTSLCAGASQGEFTTRPFKFTGNSLLLNAETSGAGILLAELLRADGASIPGFGMEECRGFYGDRVDFAMEWNGGRDLGELAGRPVRLRVRLREADFYSFQFVTLE